jgi:hypothetical protein
MIPQPTPFREIVQILPGLLLAPAPPLDGSVDDPIEKPVQVCFFIVQIGEVVVIVVKFP